jgi:CDP-diacylglycerol--glycerol-3-phosphate 3-phosphatidyltransferase
MCSALTDCPLQANGFFTAKGVSGSIPAAYTFVEKQFFEKVQFHGQAHRLRIFEWFKTDWTYAVCLSPGTLSLTILLHRYHAKGLWLGHDGPLPSVTLIGSSNLGIRSARRDLEAQLFIITENAGLRARLEQERKHFYKDDIIAVTEATFQGPQRRVPFAVRWAAEFVRTFL